jgi:hypothetical protein
MGIAISTSQWLNVLVNAVLPIVVAIVTSKVAGGAVKALTLLILSAVSGFLVSWLAALDAGEPFSLSAAGFTALMGLVIAVAAHFGLWKPTGVTGSDGVVQTRLSGGIGGRGTA